MVRSLDESTIGAFNAESNQYHVDTEVFKIEVALVVYKSTKNNQYMEKINFKADPRDNSMIAVGASPVRMKDIYAMRKALHTIKEKPTVGGANPMESANFKGMMPEHIIYWSRDDYKKIIWTMEPGMLKIDMSYDGGSYTIPMDTILFATDGNNIKGFLIPKTKTFDEYSVLDQLPLPNFYSSNNMCNGNTKLGVYDTMEGYLKAWENRVFQTKYSNENMGVGGLHGLKQLDGKKRLPKRYRASSNIHVKDLIQWLKT